MQVKHAIILSAGRGSRMGPLGEVLAKPVWPFFGKELIQLQINFLKDLGIEKFYINSHHLHEQLNYLKDDNVEIIYEPILLDQGGGILNILKKFNLWDLPVLINNADQLYFISKEELSEGLKKLEKNDAVLYALEVEKDKGYNGLIINEKEILEEIVPNSNLEQRIHQTYSGLALLKCKKVSYENQVVSFFNSVANFKDKKVILKIIVDGEYYDFGKLESYYNLCMEVNGMLKGSDHPKFKVFFQKYLSLGLNKDKEGLNFSSDPSAMAKEGEILLDEGIIFKEGERIISNLRVRK